MNNRALITGLWIGNLALLIWVIFLYVEKEKERKEKKEAWNVARQNGKVANNSMAELSRKETEKTELEQEMLNQAEESEEEDREPIGYDNRSKRELREGKGE